MKLKKLIRGRGSKCKRFVGSRRITLYCVRPMRTPIVKAALVTLLPAFIAGILFAQSAAKPQAVPNGMPAVPRITSLPAAAEQAMAAIDPEQIRAHVKFLASDQLEGRGTGQRGGDLAARYIASQFALYGLQPAGDDGSYLQKVPMVGIANAVSTSISLVPERSSPIDLRSRVDIVAMDETGNMSDEVDAPIVWMGYGIDAPEYKWNDFKDADVKGKVLLMMVNQPPSDDPKFFQGGVLTYYGRWTYKFEEAARKGAVGVMLIHKTDMASYGWNVVRNSWAGERAYLRNETTPKLKLASWIQLDIARKLAQQCGMDLDEMMAAAQKPGFRPVALPARLKAHMVSEVRSFDAYNVLAKLPGSDRKLAQQAVMFTAHYDHLGIKPGMPGDNIYNGAQDNATGVGILLEIARAFAAAKSAPKRSIYLASVTAEEQGLRGSEFLGKHPPIPATQISLDLNYDDVPTLGVPEEVNVTGAERTTFFPVVQRTAREFGLTIVPDSQPAAGHFYRSDHFSLARAGIPAFSINEGDKYQGHDRAWGVQQGQDFVDNRYHSPADEYRPDMDFRGDAVMGRFGMALAWLAANQPAKVEWKPGEEFGRR